MCGNPSEARRYLTEASDLDRRSPDWDDKFQYVQDVRVALSTYGALTLWYEGFPDQARDPLDGALDRARDLRHTNTLAYALTHGGWLQTLCLDAQAARRYAEELIALSEELALRIWGANGRVLLAWTLTREGLANESVAMLREAIAKYRSVNWAWHVPTYLIWLAEACRAAGRPEDGQLALSEARDLIEVTGHRISEAEMYRVSGELDLLCGRGKDAETQLNQAITIARNQGIRPFELRAATRLARLWQSQGKTTEARDLLAPVYGWFTEGFDTADLKEAKALLQELDA